MLVISAKLQIARYFVLGGQQPDFSVRSALYRGKLSINGQNELHLCYNSALKVTKSGIECTIQDLPGRTMRHGMPTSGPMDSLAFSAGNLLVGNAETTEGLEIVLIPGVPFSAHFFVSCVLAVTGKDVSIKINGQEKETWSRIVVPADGKLQLETKPPALNTSGFRVYLSIRGGFPGIPVFLGSKSTSVGVGGHQVCGVVFFLGTCSSYLFIGTASSAWRLFGIRSL